MMKSWAQTKRKRKRKGSLRKQTKASLTRMKIMTWKKMRIVINIKAA